MPEFQKMVFNLLATDFRNVLEIELFLLDGKTCFFI